MASFFGTIYEFLSDFKSFEATNFLCTNFPAVDTSSFVASLIPCAVVDTHSPPVAHSSSSFVVVADTYTFLFLLLLLSRSEELRPMTRIGRPEASNYNTLATVYRVTGAKHSPFGLTLALSLR